MFWWFQHSDPQFGMTIPALAAMDPATRIAPKITFFIISPIRKRLRASCRLKFAYSHWQ